MTEGIATMERLAYEMITGDRTKRPSRLWRQFRTMVAINERGWPWIDSQVFDIENLNVEGIIWPRDPGGIPYFTQTAALRYHYGVGIANQQQCVLSNLLIQHSYQSVYRSAVEGVGYIIKNILKGDIYRFLLNGFTVLRIRKFQKQRISDIMIQEGFNDEKMERCLVEWEQSHNPLTMR